MNARFHITLSVLIAAALHLIGARALATDEIQTFIAVPDAEARIAEATKDVRKLVDSRYPSVDDIGEGWLRPWEAPPGVPSAFRSERQFWASVRPPRHWAQWYGMPRAEIAELVRPAILEIVRQTRAEAVPPGMDAQTIARLRDPAGFLGLELSFQRIFNLPAFESAVSAGPRLQTITLEFVRKSADTERRHQKERQEHDPRQPAGEMHARHRAEMDALAFEQLDDFYDVLCADVEAASFDEMIQAFVAEVSSVHRIAEMTYIHIDPESFAAAEEDPSVLPTFGRVTVEMRLLARETIGTRVRDLTEGDLSAARERMQQTLDALIEITQGMGQDQIEPEIEDIQAQIDSQARQRTSYVQARDRATTDGDRAGAQGQIDTLDARMEELKEKLLEVVGRQGELDATAGFDVELEMRDLGDNSWVAVLEGPEIDGVAVDSYHARLRNGNAVVNIRAGGTYPKTWFLKQLEWFLAAMDERTAMYAE